MSKSKHIHDIMIFKFEYKILCRKAEMDNFKWWSINVSYFLPNYKGMLLSTSPILKV